MIRESDFKRRTSRSLKEYGASQIFLFSMPMVASESLADPTQF